jgi:hypothetical protein
MRVRYQQGYLRLGRRKNGRMDPIAGSFSGGTMNLLENGSAVKP